MQVVGEAVVRSPRKSILFSVEKACTALLQWFQQNVAPPHTGRVIEPFLLAHLPRHPTGLYNVKTKKATEVCGGNTLTLRIGYQ